MEEKQLQEQKEDQEINEQQDNNNSDQENQIENKSKVQKNEIKGFQEFQKKEKEKGVCYLSKIPPFMTAIQVRELLESYGIERMYLVPEPESKRLERIRRGGNKKKRCYEEGWVEFTDKRIARMAALSLNCQKMYKKSHKQFADDTWNIRYLPKFKWENLTEKFAYDAKMRKQKMQKQMQIAKKEHDFFQKKTEHSKKIQHIQERMQKKKIKLENQTNVRNVNQKTQIQKGIEFENQEE